MQLHQALFKKKSIITTLFCFGLLLFAAGISWSTILISNSIMIISILMLFKYNRDLNQIQFNRNLHGDFNEMIKNPLLLSMMGIFISLFISGLWSESLKDWLWFSRMKLPFLLLPLSFYIHGHITMRMWKLVGGVLILFTFIVSVSILLNYFEHYKEYNLSLLKGKSIVNVVSHIRFSMLLTINSIICLHYFFTKRLHTYKFEKYIAIGFFLYFFLFIHLLSVKTGILSLYLALLVYTGMFFFSRKLIKQGWLFIGSIIGLVFLSFLFIPSLQNKFYYTIWQIGEWQRGKWLLYSDLERLVSWQIGIEMIKHHPVFGSGIGDLYQMTKETYLECYNMETGKLPHNQFLFSWAFTGLPGLISLSALLYYSIFQKSWWKHPLIIAIQCILVFSLLFEYTLETQVGCNLYLYFTLMSWIYIRVEHESNNE